MLIKTKRMLKKLIVRLGVCLAVVLLCYVNVRRLDNNIYSNYERAVDYGRVQEKKEIVHPVITALFYQSTGQKKKDLSTYFDRADNYKEKNVKMVIVPKQMNDDTRPVVEKLYEEISNNNSVKKIALLAENNIYTKAHAALLQKVIKSARLQVFVLNESDIKVEKTVEKYLDEDGSLTVVLADLSSGTDEEDSDFLTEEIVWLAQKYAYGVTVFDAVDTQIAKAADKDYETLFSPAVSKEEPMLKKQQSNLQKYVNQYKDLLLEYFKLNFSLGLEKETIWPAKNEQTYRLYDRGAVYMRFFGENKKELFARAKIGNNKGVIVSVVELARKAVRKISQPIKMYKIYLLSDFEEIEPSIKSLHDDLDPDDGIYIQYKNKKALLVYDERPQKASDLIKLLYARAGVPQDADINDIKLFKFKTVEIENEN